MKIVLDTDVLIAAMRSPTGASAALLRAVRQRRVTLLASITLAVEYEAVCRRPEHRRAARLSADEVDVFLDAVIGMAEPVVIYYLWRPQLNDPMDEMVLEAAINGRADAVVTFNVRDFGRAPRLFGIEVLRPHVALARVSR